MIVLPVGIDLGTSNSSMAIFDGKQLNTIKVTNNPILPSLVYFDPFGEDVIVGRTDVVKDFRSKIYDCKRFIGRKFNEPQVKAMQMHYPFKIIEENNNIKFEVVHNKNKVKKSPEEVSAEILKYLCDCLSSFYQEEVEIEAVITIPAHFNESQRNATQKAAEIANIKILQLMKEPTAVAYNYLLEVDSTEGYIFVFDLGGGTFDVSVVEKRDKQLKIICSDGDCFLGGANIDEIILKHFKSQFVEENKLLSPLQIARLLTASKEIKEELSEKKTVHKKILNFFDGENSDIELKLNRFEFDLLISNFIERCIQIIDSCLDKNNVEKTSIKEVVLVGGSTHILKLQNRIKEYFGDVFYPEIDRDLSVTFGAAKRAFTLNLKTAKKPKNDDNKDTDKIDYSKTVYNEETTKKFQNNSKKDTEKIDYSKSVYNEETAKKLLNDSKINTEKIDYSKTVYNEETAKKLLNDSRKNTDKIDYSKTVFNEETTKKLGNDYKKDTVKIDYSKSVYNEETAKKLLNDSKINTEKIDYSKTVYNEETTKKLQNNSKKNTDKIDYSKTVYNEETTKKLGNNSKKDTVKIDYSKTVYNEETAKKLLNDYKKDTVRTNYSTTVYNEETAKKLKNDNYKTVDNIKSFPNDNKSIFNSNTHINDVTSFNIGYKLIFDTFELLVAKNSTLPQTKHFTVKTVTNNQTILSLKFFEGRWKCCSKNHFLGEITFKDIPKKSAGLIHVDGIVEINDDNKINITAEVRETEEEKKLEFSEIEETNDEIWTEQLDKEFDDLTGLKIKFYKSWKELIKKYPENLMLVTYQCYDILNDIKNKAELKEEMEQFFNDFSYLDELELTNK